MSQWGFGHRSSYYKKGQIITCDSCEQNFDLDEKTPTILPDCGHTLCAQCVQEILSQEQDRKCFICSVEVDGGHVASNFKANLKIIQFLEQNQNKNNVTVQNGVKVPCPRHQEQTISYFCKACNLTVCVDCMYDQHNGHLLTNFYEMSKSVKQNVADLSTMLISTRRIVEDNLALIVVCREEINKLLNQQITYIEEGFQDIFRRLNEKKAQFSQHFDNLYKKEDQLFVSYQNTHQDYQNEMAMIEKVFVELIQFIDGSNDSQILAQFEDVSEFIKKSFDKLEQMASKSLIQKKQVAVDSKLSPFIVDTQKAVLLVNQFQMIPPSKEAYNQFELKFLRKNDIINEEFNLVASMGARKSFNRSQTQPSQTEQSIRSETSSQKQIQPGQFSAQARINQAERNNNLPPISRNTSQSSLKLQKRSTQNLCPQS